MAAKTSRLPPRLILIAAGVLLAVLLVHLGGVAALRYLVERELHPALPQGTYIGDVHLNLFSGSLEIEGFELRVAGTRRLRAGHLVVRVSPWRLLTGTLHVREAALRQAYVRVERRADGTIDLGLPDFGGAEPAAADGAAPLAVSLAGATAERVTIDYHDGDLTSEIYVNSLKVGAYSSSADSQQVAVDWRLHWDDREVTGDAQVTLADGPPGVRGTLRTALLDLARAQRLARLPAGVDGELAYQGGFGWSGGRLALAGDLQAPRLAYAGDGVTAALSQLELPGLQVDVLTTPQLELAVRPGADSRVASWQAGFGDQRLGGDGLALGGVLRYAEPGVIDVDELRLQADSLVWADAGRRLQLAGLAIDGRARHALDGASPYPALNATLGAASIDYADDAAAVAVALTDLQVADVAIAAPGDAGGQRLDGRVTLAQSTVTQGDTVLGWQAVDATLGGELGNAAIQLGSDTTVSGLSVANPVFEHGPLRIDRVALQGVEVGAAVAFAALRVDGLALPGDPDETSLQIGAIRVAASRYAAGQGVAVGEITVDGLQGAVIRDSAGQWRYPMAAAAGAPAPTTGTAPADTDADTDAGEGEGGESLAWRVAGLRIGGDSYLTAADALNPDVPAPRFKIDRLQIGALASDAPGTATPFDVVLRPDAFSEFVIRGEVRPLASDLFLDAEGHLHGFAMQTFNGLIANDLGHRFVNGQLDNDFRIRIERNRLDMTNALALATVEAEEIAGKEGPPLATAIALLEDRDGNIKLDVPVAGNLDDPEFRVLGALNPIIMKAVAGTAALAIQPLGSVLLVGGLLADQALKVTFQPALFDAGSTELNAGARKYLGQLAGKLREKPKLRVRVCGVVVAAERRRDDKGKAVDRPEDLLKVAQLRADAAKAYLASQGAGGRQLRRCRPSLDAGADAKPRVDIKF